MLRWFLKGHLLAPFGCPKWDIKKIIAADPKATVKVTLEISADFPNGATEQTKRAVAENAAALGPNSKLWE